MTRARTWLLLALAVAIASPLVSAARAGLPRMAMPTPRSARSYGNDAAAGSSSSSLPTPPAYKELWFTQDLDHFNMYTPPHLPATFEQRYLVNADQFDASAPLIILYPGNEGDIVSFWNNTGLMFEWAGWSSNPLGPAMVIAIEHRFYGLSVPGGSNNTAAFSTPLVSYCSAEQALADYATVITAIKAADPALADAPVFVMGGSYGGMLAAWFRMKYPNIVFGALAASAPILEFDGLCDGEAFSAIATADFAEAEPGCAPFIQEMYNNVLPNLGQTAAGRATITSAMRLCEPILNSTDMDVLFGWTQTAFLYMAMTDYPYEADFLQVLPANPVNVSCALALDNDGTIVSQLSAFASAAGLFYNYTGSEACYNINQPMSPNLGMAAWAYQACSEMVFPISQNGKSDMFWPAPFNLKEYEEGCFAAYGVTPRADWIPIEFGGANIQAASNIIFSNGVLDPWLSGGVTASLSDSLVAIVIEHAAHHLDLRWSNPADPQSVVEARAQELALAKSWLAAERAAIAVPL